MKRIFLIVLILAALYITIPCDANAQFPLGGGDRYIRVAEMGELVDSVNVWGDVNSAGRYLVPEGTKLPELLSFSYGPSQIRRGGAGASDWSKLRYEVKVTRFNNNNRLVDVAYFRYRYYDPEPPEMYEFELQNNDLVTVQVQQTPSFADYVRIIGPVISIVATSVLLIERLR